MTSCSIIAVVQMAEPSRTLARLDHQLWPASINSYYRCPRKFQFRYLRRVKPAWEFSPALVIGGIAHKAMSDLFSHRRDGQSVNTVETYVDRRMGSERYPPETADILKAEHFPIIVEHVASALSCMPENAEILEVEHVYDFDFRPIDLAENVSIKCRIDLVIRHGNGIVDHIDFKTGFQGGDLFQKILSRVTVANHLKLPSEQLRTVNVLTRTGTYQIVPTTREQHRSTWEMVRSLVVVISPLNVETLLVLPTIL